MQYLIEHGADIHTMDDLPLIWAVDEKCWDIARYLVMNGTNVHARNNEILKVLDEPGNEEIKNYVLLSG